MAKTREYECPKCGEFEEVYNIGEPWLEAIEQEDGNICDIVSIERKCHKCGHTWTEGFRAVYDGYVSENTLYDKDGNEISG